MFEATASFKLLKELEAKSDDLSQRFDAKLQTDSFVDFQEDFTAIANEVKLS
jgi:hypothetical protein